MKNFITVNGSAVTLPLSAVSNEWVSPLPFLQIFNYVDMKEYTSLYSFDISVGTYVADRATVFAVNCWSSNDALSTSSPIIDLSTLTVGDNVKVITVGEVSLFVLYEADYLFFYYVDALDDTAKTLVDDGLSCDGITPLKKVGV